MPHYFFDTIENGKHIQDNLGLLCSSRRDAQVEALKALSSIAKDQIPQEGDRQAYMVLVRDEESHAVYSTTLTFAGQWLDGKQSSTKDAPA